MELPSTLRAWQGRGQVPWPWIGACLARRVRTRCTVGLVQSRRSGAPHQGTAPRQPLKYTKASSHPWSGSSFTILLLFFLHPKPCLMDLLMVLSLGNSSQYSLPLGLWFSSGCFQNFSSTLFATFYTTKGVLILHFMFSDVNFTCHLMII